jgi:hypothetical protein
MKTALLVWLGLVACAVPASAQEREPAADPIPQFEQRFDELAAWLREYEVWERWFEVWCNRVARSFDGHPVWDRRMRPQPPDWLSTACREDWVYDDLLTSACYVLRHWDAHPLQIIQRRDSSSRLTPAGDDRVVKNSFLTRMHLTGLWLEARYPATPAYGIVGMQIGVYETGRFVLPAVGVMVVLMPDSSGGHALRPATTLGFGYRLLDFVPPFLARQASLHFNVAYVNLPGASDATAMPGFANTTLFGLSVSARRYR